MNIVGNFHLLLLHFPVALILVAWGMLAYRMGFKRIFVAGRVEQVLVPLAAVATVLATATGFIHHLGAEWNEAHIGPHAILGYVTTGLILVAWMFQRKHWGWLYTLALTGAAVTLVWGAHHGGMLTHVSGIFG